MEQHKNPDGTYDGAGVLSEVSGLSREMVKELWEEVQANNAKLNACLYHEFEQSPKTAMLRSLTHQKYICKHCGGEVNYHAYLWHQTGRRARP